MNKFKNHLCNGLLIVFISFSIVAVLEMSLRALRHFQKESSQQSNPFYRSGLMEKDYANKLWNEYQSRPAQLKPYIHWQMTAMKGDLININDSGTRKTLFNSNLPTSKNVFCFGGSTLWGTGTEDAHTIPSQLSQALNKSGDFTVHNYGQIGYNSTQEMLKLIFELNKGNIPDIVVFYDGFNDAYVGGYSPGDPGKFHQYQGWEEKLNRKWRLSEFIKARWRRSYIFRFLQNKKLSHHEQMAFDQLINENDIPKRAEAVAQQYIRNIQMINKLGDVYGFKTYFFWQPVLLEGNKKQLAGIEPTILNEQSQKLQSIIKETYRVLHNTDISTPRIYNISALFDDNPNQIYIDECHVTQTGNKIIADAMAQQIL